VEGGDLHIDGLAVLAVVARLHDGRAARLDGLEDAIPKRIGSPGDVDDPHLEKLVARVAQGTGSGLVDVDAPSGAVQPIGAQGRVVYGGLEELQSLFGSRELFQASVLGLFESG
jgi:hypothetical protein